MRNFDYFAQADSGYGSKYKELARIFKSASPRATRIICDEAAEAWYLRHNIGTSLSVSDFPNVAPPFAEMWIDYIDPRSAGETKILPGAQDLATNIIASSHLRRTLLISVVDLSIAEQRASLPDAILNCSECTEFLAGRPKRARWMLVILALGRIDRLLLYESNVAAVPVASDGSLFDSPVSGAGVMAWSWILPDMMRIASESERELLMEDARKTSPALGVGLFCLSLMNCRNVRIDIVEPHVSKKVKRRGECRLSYRTLRIADGTHGRGVTEDGYGVGVGMHVMRGHFKDYTKSGLFGQHRGIYWWHENVRGDISRGAVVKTYLPVPR